MKEEVLRDWLDNGMPCLACGERTKMKFTFNERKNQLILEGQCDPCSASPIGINPMMLIGCDVK